MKVAVIITARPSYARIKTAITALVARGADVTILACASALLERYGHVVEVIRQEFPDVPLETIWSTYEGANLVTSAKETGALCAALAGVLCARRPDYAVVVADRHEVLGATQAASYQHVPVVHIQGGERTGSIDDRVRDSITALSDIHCVSTVHAKYRVYGLTGDWAHIHVTGCPSIDLAEQAYHDPHVFAAALGGTGPAIDLQQPFVVWLQHPVTNEPDAAAQMACTAAALQASDVPVLALWPGEDAGAEAQAKVLRAHQSWLHTVRNLPPARFLRLLTQASALVGNSSVGIREGSYLGVPVVNIGTRQQGRERGPNVRDVPYDVDAIHDALAQQIDHGPYPCSTLYGSGDAGAQIAEVLLGARRRSDHPRAVRV